MTRPTRLAILVIGNEILSGKVDDLNSTFAAKAAFACGVSIHEVRMVPDVRERIIAAVLEMRAQVDALVTSGGIGPTHDDLTIPCVAEALGLPLERHAEYAQLLESFYGMKLTPAHLAMANLPVGARIVRGPSDSAPVLAIDNLYLLPGEPTLFRRKWAVVLDHCHGTPLTLARLYFRGDEGEFAAALGALQREHPDVEIGSYPVYRGHDYDVQITIEGLDQTRVVHVARLVCALVGPDRLLRSEPASLPLQ